LAGGINGVVLSELVLAGGIISVVLGFIWMMGIKVKSAHNFVSFVSLSIVLFTAATFLALSAADAVSDASSLANATLTWPLTFKQKRYSDGEVFICREAWARYAGVEFSYDDDYNLTDRTDSRTGEGLLDENGIPFAAHTKLDSTGTGDGVVAEVPAQLSLIVGLFVFAAVWAASLGCLVLCCQGADGCTPVKDEDGDAAAANIEIVDEAQGSLFGASGVAPSTAVYAARGTPFSSAQRAAEQGRLGVATVGGELVVVQGLVLTSNNV
jgi:hypothetical protein